MMRTQDSPRSAYYFLLCTVCCVTTLVQYSGAVGLIDACVCDIQESSQYNTYITAHTRHNTLRTKKQHQLTRVSSRWFIVTAH